MRLKRRWLAAIVVPVIAAAGTLSWIVQYTPYIRDRAVTAINERFASQVELESLQIGVFPSPSIAGVGLRIRHNGRTDVPPLINVGVFSATGGLYGLFGKPFRVRNVSLEHLEIHVPRGGVRGAGALPQNNTPMSHPAPPAAASSAASPIVLDEVVSRSAVLEIASSRPDRLPRVFDIHDLVMTAFGRPEGSSFHAGLTNPVPRGRVETSGIFGPWEAENPRLTPIRGEYAFRNADMNAIKGLGGTLSSVGRYAGVLQRIDVEGQTEIPDFSIDLAGQPVPLRTQFKAVVDGTTGDTFLNRIEARLRESSIIASGSVVRTMEARGRHVKLDIRIADGRIEDLMQLVVKGSSPPLSGRVNVETAFVLPAGDRDVVERLELDGRFRLASAHFANINVQERINALSLRGRGIEDATADAPSVVSDLSGQFHLTDGLLTFSELTFAVPGAAVTLSGSYHLRDEQMAFAGNLLLDATLPDTMRGWRSLLARAVQPFFRRPGGGSQLPIRISGPRARPVFGLDVRRAFWLG
jgi:hypothetical protein